MTLSNFCPQSALDIAARKRIFVQEAFDHIYLSLTFIWQLITFRVKPNSLTPLPSYFLSYFTSYTTAILNFFQLFPVTMFSCSVGLCTCSFLCLEHLPQPVPSSYRDKLLTLQVLSQISLLLGCLARVKEQVC